MTDNRIENATRELRAAIQEDEGDVYSDAFGETLDCLVLLANHVKPAHRFLRVFQVQAIQDMSHEATTDARQTR